MYNQYLKVQPTKTGSGVFTTVDIPANVPIIEITGQIYIYEQLPDPNDQVVTQVGPNIYIGRSGTIDDHIAHSCNPNSLLHCVGNRAIIYSMYVIKAGNEITFDYSTSSNESLDSWKMHCKCGDPNCRKVISGFQYLEAKLQEEYKEKGVAALFLTHPIFMKRD